MRLMGLGDRHGIQPVKEEGSCTRARKLDTALLLNARLISFTASVVDNGPCEGSSVAMATC